MKDFVYVAHPDVDGVAHVPSSALPHMEGWAVVDAPKPRRKPTKTLDADAPEKAQPVSAKRATPKKEK